MDTGSKDEDGDKGFEEASAEPLGLSATALGRPPVLRPRTPIAPEHQQAVELISSARRHLREGRPEEAKELFRRAAHLELQVLRSSVASQPERSLIAELGARAALQGGSFDLARDLVRRGLSPRASDPMQWALLRASIEAELLDFLDEFERGWQLPWDPIEEDESRILVVSRSGRRLTFDIDPDASSVSRMVSRKASGPEELTFVIPASRPNRETLGTLETLLTPWLQPRRHAQPVSERRGVVEHFLLDPVFA